MSRVDDNQKIVEGLKKISFVDRNTAMIVSVLVDISQSLAVIADCCLDDWQKKNDLVLKTEVDDGK